MVNGEMNMIKSFEDLECWKLASMLRRRLSELVKEFPQHEKFKLTDQIIRASRSVTANIAEGYGRFHYQEYIQYCRQSRGSLYELVDHLIVATDEKYISESLFKEFRIEIEKCITVLNGFINYLSKAKHQNKVNEPELGYGYSSGSEESRLTIND
jgi:four helix bundle protein